MSHHETMSVEKLDAENRDKKKEWVSDLSFDTHPDEYHHLKLETDGPVGKIVWDVDPEAGLGDYELKINSYDIGVDIELADAVNRFRFEHPDISSIIIESGKDGVFSGGANIFMLESAHHGFKVNFCKFTNETRLAMEDASENSDQTYIAALNGTAAGGGYELALACDEIYLVDDRQSAVSLPEVPLLGVLPGTGGLTRLVDKRKVRRDLADRFCTVAEGAKADQAEEWDLVDGTFPKSEFEESVRTRAEERAGEGHPERNGVELPRLNPEEFEDGVSYKFVELERDDEDRVATLTIEGPADLPPIPDHPEELGGDWYPLRVWREVDAALCRLRFNYPRISVVKLRTTGDVDSVLKLDEQMVGHDENWFINEVRLLAKRALKRLDYSSKSFFALIEEDTCFAGQFLELALAADQIYLLETDKVRVGVSELNGGALPMGNGLSRLETRFQKNPDRVEELMEKAGTPLSAPEAEAAGLATDSMGDIYWEDEVRLAVEERASISPDGLTGMEANLRFPGPESMETKIFGRLSAFQNWIFRGENAVGEKGTLTTYRSPENADLNWIRT